MAATAPTAHVVADAAIAVASADAAIAAAVAPPDARPLPPGAIARSPVAMDGPYKFIDIRFAGGSAPSSVGRYRFTR